MTQLACILWGGYAGGNAGDELTLAVAIQDARAEFGSSFAILSRNPEYTRWLFPAENVIPYTPAPPKRPWHKAVRRRVKIMLAGAQPQISTQPASGEEWKAALNACAELRLVGGGYLTDLFDLDYFLAPVIVARDAGIRVKTAPLGIGPFLNPRSSQKFASAMQTAAVQVRDDQSLLYCQQAGLSARIARDDGFRLFEVLPDLAQRTPREYSPNPLMGISVHHQHGSQIQPAAAINWWVDLVSELKAQTVRLSGFCFHTLYQHDFYSTINLFQQAGLDPRAVSAPAADFRDAIRSLCQYDLVITTRFHAAVSADVLGIPYAPVSSGSYYTGKMESALQFGSAPSIKLAMEKSSGRAAARQIMELLP